MNSNNRRRNFRSRPQKNNFRRRGSSMNSNGSNSLNGNGNINFSRNGSMNNIHNVEKTMQKTCENPPKSRPKSMLKPSKNHQKIDVEKRSTNRGPGQRPPQSTPGHPRLR